jgi:hypothetical protein
VSPTHAQRRLPCRHLGPQPWQTSRCSRRSTTASDRSAIFLHRAPTSTRLGTSEHNARRRSPHTKCRAHSSSSRSCPLPSPHHRRTTTTTTGTHTRLFFISTSTTSTAPAPITGWCAVDVRSGSRSAGRGAVTRTDSGDVVDASITTTTASTSTAPAAPRASSTTTTAAHAATLARHAAGAIAVWRGIRV